MLQCYLIFFFTAAFGAAESETKYQLHFHWYTSHVAKLHCKPNTCYTGRIRRGSAPSPHAEALTGLLKTVEEMRRSRPYVGPRLPGGAGSRCSDAAREEGEDVPRNRRAEQTCDSQKAAPKKNAARFLISATYVYSCLRMGCEGGLQESTPAEAAKTEGGGIK